MRRTLITLAAIALSLTLAQAPAAACAGLIGSNGAVNLGRTTTLAAYHNGIEHYVTAFQFLGGGGQFGTLIPLPGIPSDVEKGGAWTLQRLIRETEPVSKRFELRSAAGPASADGVQILLEKKIDALDITVPAGVPVRFTFRNDDPIGHEWIVGTVDVHATHRVGMEPYHEGRTTEVTLPPFATRTTTITFDPGTYSFVCHLPGHEAYGMTGALTAQAR